MGTIQIPVLPKKSCALTIERSEGTHRFLRRRPRGNSRLCCSRRFNEERIHANERKSSLQFASRDVSPAYAWRLLHQWLPSDDMVRKKGVCMVSNKCTCCQSEETLTHTFVTWPIAQQVWNYFSGHFDFLVTPGMGVRQLLMTWLAQSNRVRCHVCSIIPLISSSKTPN